MLICSLGTPLTGGNEGVVGAEPLGRFVDCPVVAALLMPSRLVFPFMPSTVMSLTLEQVS